MSDSDPRDPSGAIHRPQATSFTSPFVDAARKADNRLLLPGGEILLPKVFGFCRGVERALEMLDAAVDKYQRQGKRLVLLGDIIHNPWVNNYFQSKGVRILTPEQCQHLEQHIRREDCAVIPAFGVPLPIQRQLADIGCRIIDTSCGDVRRLWTWAEHAVSEGFGVFIFGRASHDEAVVTKSRLAQAGGRYVVAGNLEEVRAFCDLVAGRRPAEAFLDIFGPQATNAPSLDPLLKLAQVSQTTMLYDETLKVREVLAEAYKDRFGEQRLEQHLRFQPTVCRATQARQSAAVELCRNGCDLTIVVGGFGSSNTRHLYELARSYCPAYLIESAAAIQSARRLETFDFALARPAVADNWLPAHRPLRIAVLAGASSPEIVVGEVLEKLAGFLA